MNTTINSHYEKYEAMYQAKLESDFDVANLIPASREQIKEALNIGDEHLNSIPLAKWDMAARNVGWTRRDSDGKMFKSLAEQVCLLKHAAIYHYNN